MFIPVDSISIGVRQRKKFDVQPLADLQESIRQRGLLHAPVYHKSPESPDDAPVWMLVVGERRTRAMQKLIEAKIRFYHNGVLVPEGMIPITTTVELLSRAERKQIEFDENKVREPLTWQEEAEALAEIHRLREEENPKQTRLETAKQLIEEKIVETSTSPHALAQRIHRAVAVAENLSNPTIAKARNETEAYNLLLKSEEERINASLARRRIAASTETPAITIRKGSCIDILSELESSIADLILVDPPFGIGADTGGFRQRTVHHHNYEDTPEIARNIAQAIILDGFRVAKPMANLFVFCDIDLFYTLRDMAARAGWVPFRTPLIWQKSKAEGLAPWQGKGPVRTYEMIFYATKGQRGLLTTMLDILSYNRVAKQERIHAAQKPLDLLSRLIEVSTLPGDFVLDPCCGSGSTLVAAKQLKRTGLGIELDDTFYNTAMSNLHGTMAETNEATSTDERKDDGTLDLA